jgi:rSAM/selenodomain-associated transferase 1
MPAHVIVFAKAPVPGLVKTRLAPAIGAAAAARLAHLMLDHTLATAAAASVGSVELCGSPADHPLLMAAAQRHGAALTAQSDGDLGRRMAAAFARTLPMGNPVLMIGSDCPALSPSLIRQAAEVLERSHDAVFTPSLDGGYVLIGLRRFAPQVFHGIAWSTPVVMQQTRSRLRALRWQWHENQPLADVDEPADLGHLPPAWHQLLEPVGVRR